MNDRRPCICGGMNEECSFCGGSGFIENEDTYTSGRIPSKEPIEFDKGLSEKEIEAFEKSLHGKRNKRITLTVKISETPAAIVQKVKIKSLLKELLELERELKEMFQTQNEKLNSSLEFKELINEAIQLRKKFSNKYKRYITTMDKYHLYILFPNLEVELNKLQFYSLLNEKKKKGRKIK